jgi:hypothetical protein
MDAAAGTALVATPVRDWIVRHDDSRAFVLLYVVLALVLSLAVGLFWLLALVGVHFGFEYVCARHRGGTRRASALAALWELRLDLALVAFALCIVLYLQFVFGVLGLQAAGRAGAAARVGVRGARFAAWERAIQSFLITMDDMARGVRAVVVLKRQRGGGAPELPAVVSGPPVRRIGTGDALTLAFGGLCVVLILLGPWLGYGSWSSVLATLGAELHPLPWRVG